MVTVYKTFNTTNPITEENLSELQELFATEYKILETHFIPRIFGVLNISAETNTMIINFHLSSNNSKDPKNYGELLDVSSNGLKHFKYGSFSMADQCMGFQIKITSAVDATWGTIDIGRILLKAKTGYCIDSQGSIIPLSCTGKILLTHETKKISEILCKNVLNVVLITDSFSVIDSKTKSFI